MKTLLKTIAARIQRVRLAIAESDLRWMEARAPISLREQRAHVAALKESVSRLSSGMGIESDISDPLHVFSTEDVRANVERRLKGALL